MTGGGTLGVASCKQCNWENQTLGNLFDASQKERVALAISRSFLP